MTPPRQDSLLGERMSGLEAKFDGFEKYEHQRWHDLANQMQPLVNLPVQLTRDIAKIQGAFDGRVASITKEIERSITAAVEKAIEPVNADVALLKSKVEALETVNLQEAGAKNLARSVLQSPILAGLIGAILAALGFVWAILSSKSP